MLKFEKISKKLIYEETIYLNEHFARIARPQLSSRYIHPRFMYIPLPPVSRFSEKLSRFR